MNVQEKKSQKTHRGQKRVGSPDQRIRYIETSEIFFAVLKAFFNEKSY